MPTKDLYEQDFFAWVTVQAELLRAGNLSDLDIEHLTEEVEAIGTSQLHDVRRRLTRILHHMLKWKYQPDLRSPGWAAALRAQRDDLAAVLAGSPSLRSTLTEALAGPYDAARTQLIDETGIFRVPPACEWTGEQVLDSHHVPA